MVILVEFKAGRLTGRQYHQLYHKAFPADNNTMTDSQDALHSGLAIIFINLVPAVHLIIILLHSGFG